VENSARPLRRPCGRWRALGLELPLKLRDLPGKRIALAPQFTQFIEDTGKLRLMALRRPALLGGIGRQTQVRARQEARP
jgi:hypothetical protein